MTVTFILVTLHHIRIRRGFILSYRVGMITSELVILFRYFVRNMITFTYLAPCISLLIMLLKMMAIIIFVSFDSYWRKIALNLSWSIMPPATLSNWSTRFFFAFQVFDFLFHLSGKFWFIFSYVRKPKSQA